MEAILENQTGFRVIQPIGGWVLGAIHHSTSSTVHLMYAVHTNVSPEVYLLHCMGHPTTCILSFLIVAVLFVGLKWSYNVVSMYVAACNLAL